MQKSGANSAERVVYHTGHEKSYTVCSAIARNTGFRLLHVKDYEVGTVPIAYGLFRGTEAVFRTAEWSYLPWFYVDHGYFLRGHYDGYYRICRNWTFFRYSQGLPNSDGQRFAALGIELAPMQRVIRRRLALLWKPSLKGAFFLPVTKLWPEEWVTGVTYYLRAAGWRAVVIDKDDATMLTAIETHEPDLVIAHDSVAMVTALIAGVPACNWAHQERILVSSEKHRSRLFSVLADCQYRLDEMRAELFW